MDYAGVILHSPCCATRRFLAPQHTSANSRYVLARNLEHRWNGLVVIGENVADFVRHVLVDEDNGDVFPA